VEINVKFTLGRVVGFFRPIQNWNKGMKEQYKDRKEYGLPSTDKQ
jgi:ribonucleoside-triphosphate reductase